MNHPPNRASKLICAHNPALKWQLAVGSVSGAPPVAHDTGHSRGVFWLGIEVVRQPGNPPQLQFHAGAAKRFASLGATGSLLTITHSQELAMAQVLLLRD